MKFLFFSGIIIASSFFVATIQQCIRRPQGANGESSAVDDSFRITFDGNPATYIPGQSYNVSLSCDPAFKFISFTLVAEAEPGAPYGPDMTGHFDIIDSAETRFSNLCENMIESSNTNIKHRIDVAWIAPTNPNSSCVYIKAAVLQHRNVWFIDDGFLTKRICPEEIDDVNSQTPLVNPCCACDEAKYELVVERRWTRNTHPKDFPKDDWRTRFSELIGASHTYDYRFWAYGHRASPGLKELAEHGATRTLEDEIKEHSESGAIRTIIKAPGVQFRKNVMSTTMATVRVDPRHHMVSFVTKIIPSPDWIIGVAGLELCLANCTWINEKVLNLFPWDIGTDSGPSYMSPDQQQVPADVVRHITSTFPSDYHSPFYDESGAPMKPMATLYMRRKKLYERECEADDNVPLECATHPWVDWSECSTKCGVGSQTRERAYKDPGLAARYNCEVVLRQTQRCIGSQCGLEIEDDGGAFGQQTAECELTNWSSWAPCSKSCGRGLTKRTRDYHIPYARENCQAGYPVELEQTKECLGNACGGTIAGATYGTDNNNIGFEDNREPGLMEENNSNSDYGRRNEVIGFNANDRLPNQRNRYGGGEQNNFGLNNRDNEQPNENFGYGSINDNNNGNNYGNLEERIFGNEDNRENNLNYNRNSNNEHWLGSSLNRVESRRFPENTFVANLNQNSQNLNNFNEMLPPQSYNQQQQLPNERIMSRFQSPGFYTKTNPRYNSDIAHELQNNNAQFREVVDEFGQKILMAAGTPPDQYTVVQHYCFEKPIVLRRTCAGKKVISNYWFYDAGDRDCKIFTTDNCDENKNKFRSLESCEGTCLQPQLNLEEHQFQDAASTNENNNWAKQFGGPHSQIRPTITYGRRQQHLNSSIQQRPRNRINDDQKRF